LYVGENRTQQVSAKLSDYGKRCRWVSANGFLHQQAAGEIDGTCVCPPPQGAFYVQPGHPLALLLPPPSPPPSPPAVLTNPPEPWPWSPPPPQLPADGVCAPLECICPESWGIFNPEGAHHSPCPCPLSRGCCTPLFVPGLPYWAVEGAVVGATVHKTCNLPIV
jgi:hypothetical protein